MGQIRPLVSICIPAYNAESTIEETLASVLAQTYKPLEIIVSDNHSTDRTYEILQAYRNKIKVTRCPARQREKSLKEASLSAIENMNHVAEMATGEFVALYHADDVYEKTIVEEEVEFLRHNLACGAVFTMCHFIDQYGRELPIKQKGAWRALDKTLFNFGELFEALVVHWLPLNTPSVMFRKDLIRSVGLFRRTYEQAADYDMWLRMAEVKQIGILDRELFLRRISPTQGVALGRQIYRYQELPIRGLLSYYIENREAGKCISQKARLMIQWGSFCDRIRIVLNCYESDRVVVGNRHLTIASDLASNLSVVADRNVRRWRFVYKLLVIAKMMRVQQHLSKWVNRYIQKKKNYL